MYLRIWHGFSVRVLNQPGGDIKGADKGLDFIQSKGFDKALGLASYNLGMTKSISKHCGLIYALELLVDIAAIAKSIAQPARGE